MKVFSSKRRMAVAAGVILLVLFWLRPGASRLKSRIISSISSAVGRPVDVGSVHIRLLPRPGFDLQNLVVYDDPAFGAEPMLRADEVTAALRLTSLVRGRIEIARLDLTEPSLNLVHAEAGGWNFERLLERTAQIPLAPTAKAKSEPRPGFPYIQGTSARINFKNGPEKKPYALTSADFSLWQDSENSWGVRLRAQPVRTDLNLNDTGWLQVSGTWQRATALRDTPMQFNLEWSHAQVGQVTKFFTGNDQGWRGEILLDAAVTGTPAKLQAVSSASIQDFRRYDITSGQALRLAGNCTSEYSSSDHEFHGLLCSAPIAGGLITLKGDMGLLANHRYRLMLTADKIPASAAVVLVQRVKKNLPEDLVAAGTLRGTVRIDEDAAAGKMLTLDGRGEIADFHLSSSAGTAEIGPESTPFVLTSVAPGSLKRKNPAGKSIPDGPRVEVGPFPLAIGRSAGATGVPSVRGWINRSGYSFSVTGDAEIARALRVARLLGIAALQTNAEGSAQVDLEVAGSWAGPNTASGFTGPQVTGTAKLRNVRAALRGVASPVEVVAADVQLLPAKVLVGKINAKAAGASWTGSLEMPRGCSKPGACEIHFVLNANEISLAGFSEWASPGPKHRPWYRVLESSPDTAPSFLASVRASGRLTTDRFLAQSVTATRASADVSLDSGKLQVTEVRADVLGGKHRGKWQADFSVTPAVCSGSGNLADVSLARLAVAPKETTKIKGVAGIANTTYELKGTCQDFWSSAEGTLQFDISDGIMPHFALGGDAEPLRITNLSGQAHLQAGQIELKDVGLNSPAGKFLVSGTASFKGALDLTLTKSSSGTPGAYTVTGTISEPHVVPPGPETQAQLKR